MALIVLFIAFFCGLYGAYEFLSAYFTVNPQDPNSVWAVAAAGVIGFAWAAIPYLIGKCLSEMVAIRQRHLLLEQMMQQSLAIQQSLAGQARPTPSAPATPAE
jgi:hypothetical protein